METLSNILASFDIFQVLLSALPRMFAPLFEAFRDMYTNLAGIAGEQFETHPGMVSGAIIFLAGYLAWTGINHLIRQKTLAARPVAGKQS